MSWTQASDDWGCCVAAFTEIQTGINVSKVNAYSVLAQPLGISVSKVNVYAVLVDVVDYPPIMSDGDTFGVCFLENVIA